MAFDDVLQPRKSSRDAPSKKSHPKQQSKSPNSKTSIFTNLNVQEWAKEMGLSEDLTQQVIIPLVAILDKHGGNLVDTQSSEIQSATSLIGTIGEFAPLLQGAYNYFSGVRKELNAADEALLEAHNAALSATELSSLFGGDEGLVVENESAPSPEEPQKSKDFGPDGFNPPQASPDILASGKVDYYELLGYGSENNFKESIGLPTTSTDTIYTAQQDNLEAQIQAKTSKPLQQKENAIIPVGSLTLENGMTQYEIERADTNTKIKQGLAVDTVEITKERVADDINEIQRLMKQEGLKMKTSSSVAVAPVEMSAEDIIADMKAKARPGQGAQQTGEVRKGGSSITVSDEELASLTSNAFSIPGLAELQAQEAANLKASSKMDDTSVAFAEEEKGQQRIKESPFNQTIIPSTETGGLKPITWEEAVQQEHIESTDIEENED